MLRIIFIITFFLSSNVFAATYLLCEGGSKPIQVKLGNKKLYIKYEGDEEFVNYTKYLVSWTDEMIITEKNIEYDKEKFISNCLAAESIKWKNRTGEKVKKSGLITSYIKTICEEKV